MAVIREADDGFIADRQDVCAESELFIIRNFDHVIAFFQDIVFSFSQGFWINKRFCRRKNVEDAVQMKKSFFKRNRYDFIRGKPALQLLDS